MHPSQHRRRQHSQGTHHDQWRHAPENQILHGTVYYTIYCSSSLFSADPIKCLVLVLHAYWFSAASPSLSRPHEKQIMQHVAPTEGYTDGCVSCSCLVEAMWPVLLFCFSSLVISLTFALPCRGIRMWNCSSLPPSASQTLSGTRRTVRDTLHKWTEDYRKGPGSERGGRGTWGKLKSFLLKCSHYSWKIRVLNTS